MILSEEEVDSMLTPAQARELIRGERARAEFAIHAQRKLAEVMRPARDAGSLGRRVASINVDLAARIRVKYGMSCFADPDFVHALLRDNPFLRVPYEPGKLTLRVDGRRDGLINSRRPEKAAPGREECARRGAEPEIASTPAAAVRRDPAVNCCSAVAGGGAVMKERAHSSSPEPRKETETRCEQ